jgi:hypothetical protein
MFPYDAQLAAAVQDPPQSIAGVLNLLQTIQNTCVDLDGLKWFNWLYLSVTDAIEQKVAAGGFNDARWLTALDVQFAALYFRSLYGGLTGRPCPACWNTMFAARNQARIARIQFALAGMNAHINHDLPMAIVSTSQAMNTVPQHGTPQYDDYTALNATLDTVIDPAKLALNVRLTGDALPAISHVEDMVAAWDLADFREKAWNTAQSLWGEPALLQSARMGVIDGLVAGMNKLLLVPEP